MLKVFIYFTFGEGQPDEIIIDPNVQSMGCLFQPIQCLLELSHMRLFVEGLKSFRLLNVHLLLNQPIEKCFLVLYLGWIIWEIYGGTQGNNK